MTLLRLLDASGMFHPIWRVKEAQNKPTGDAAAETVQALRERAAAGDADYIVACCDAERCFRYEIAMEYRSVFPDYRGYKANRPPKDAAMMAALDRMIDELEQDGTPIMRATGFEADDVIATLTGWAVANGIDVEIVSEDKDLLALIRDADPDSGSPSVVVIRRDGTRQTSAECIARMGVPPELLPHLLALSGDTSDGVRGLPGIGQKTAAALLWGERDSGEWRKTPFRNFTEIVNAAVEEQALVEQIEREKLRRRVEKGTKQGVTDQKIADTLKITLDDVATLRVYPAFDFPADYKPRFAKDVRQSLIAYSASYDIGLRLTTLRTDVPLDFAAVTAPRVPKPKGPSADWKARGERAKQRAAEEETIVADLGDFNEEEEQTMSDQTIIAPPSAPLPVATEAPVVHTALVVESGAGIVPPGPEPKQSAAITLARTENNTSRLARYVLEPRNYQEARDAAEDAAASRLYKGITAPAEALQIIMKGRKYGLTVADSLQMIHMIEGKPSMSAQLIIGLVMSSGYAEYLDFCDVTEQSATWETKRRGGRRPMRWSFSVDDARKALLGGVKVDKATGNYSDFDPASNWAKHPKVMCLWRAGVFLCRAVYTDIVGGLYMPDEVGGAEPEIDGNLPTHGAFVMAAA